MGIDLKLQPLEKKTFIYLLIAVFLNAFVEGVANVQDIIGKKALDALDWQITVMAMIWPVSNFFSIWWGKVLEQTNKRSFYFLLLAFVGRLPLIFAVFITGVYHFMGFLILMLSFNSLLLPAQNSILQKNLRPVVRGKLFGYTASIRTFVIVVFSFISGRLLDIDESIFRYLLVITGISGCLGAVVLSLIPVKEEKRKPSDEKINWKKIFVSPLIRTFKLLKNNRDFALFERNFMIYGVGFLILIPVIPKYLVEYLEMTYTTTFLAKGVVAQLGILIFAPISGKIHDSKHPYLFAGMAFAALSLYPFTFFISSLLEVRVLSVAAVFVAYTFFGIAMSSVFITWNLGSIYFAGQEDASMYQSVHVTLTGFRGLIVPPIGLVLMKVFGVSPVFIISFLAFLIAAYLSYQQYLRNKNKDEPVEEEVNYVKS